MKLLLGKKISQFLANISCQPYVCHKTFVLLFQENFVLKAENFDKSVSIGCITPTSECKETFSTVLIFRCMICVFWRQSLSFKNYFLKRYATKSTIYSCSRRNCRTGRNRKLLNIENIQYIFPNNSRFYRGIGPL